MIFVDLLLDIMGNITDHIHTYTRDKSKYETKYTVGECYYGVFHFDSNP